MSARDPFDELGVDPGASEEEIQRAYRRRVVERHRRGVFDIVERLRRAQRAFAALSNPAERDGHRRERLLRESARVANTSSARTRQLAMLQSYKSDMNRALARIGVENAERHAAELAEIEREVGLQEARSQALARRRQVLGVVRGVLLLSLFLAIALALWIALHGA